MLEKPAIPDVQITACLQSAYHLAAAELTFLPLGADVNTAVYRVASPAGEAFFLKLRKGAFAKATVTIPRFLKTQGVPAIIAPLDTAAGQPWTRLDDYTLILYPFIDGQDGYQVGLSEQQWLAFGAALRAIHAAQLPAELARALPREQYIPQYRDSARRYQALVESTDFDDPTAQAMAAFMRAKRSVIRHLIDRADQLALDLRARPLEYVLCHSDLHPGNLLIPGGAQATGKDLFIVDWDNPSLAPKEHDLMMLGGSPVWNNPAHTALFYRGYFAERGDPVDLDLTALAYFRYERIIQDIAAFCDEILATSAGGADRAQSLRYFTGQFLLQHEVDIALETDRRLLNEYK